MDNLQFWLYVIIGVIYLISQVRKKAKSQAPQPKPSTRRPDPETTMFKPQSQPQQQSTAPKPISFEDLLREITEGKTTSAEPVEQPYKTEPEYVDYDDNLEDEEDTYQPVIPDYQKTDPIYKQYEQAKAYDYASNSLEESLKLEDVNMRFGRFTEFDAVKQRGMLEEYTQDLRNPDGFKKAIILSEILNRKHF
ncbi:MAG: hypothetical protein KF687_09680 [Cyclobacteriaceae bacterium]|nr:hypothetical protein [Cyclobacteriaceae bacterium]